MQIPFYRNPHVPLLESWFLGTLTCRPRPAPNVTNSALIYDGPQTLIGGYNFVPNFQVLPRDAEARRAFVTSKGLQKLQELLNGPGAEDPILKEHIQLINQCYPEEVVKWVRQKPNQKCHFQRFRFFPQVLLSGLSKDIARSGRAVPPYAQHRPIHVVRKTLLRRQHPYGNQGRDPSLAATSQRRTVITHPRFQWTWRRSGNWNGGGSATTTTTIRFETANSHGTKGK